MDSSFEVDNKKKLIFASSINQNENKKDKDTKKHNNGQNWLKEENQANLVINNSLDYSLSINEARPLSSINDEQKINTCNGQIRSTKTADMLNLKLDEQFNMEILKLQTKSSRVSSVYSDSCKLKRSSEQLKDEQSLNGFEEESILNPMSMISDSEIQGNYDYNYN